MASPRMDRLSVFREKITVPWVEQYLEHRLENPLDFHRTLRMSYSDQPTHSPAHSDFLHSLPPIKLVWERMDAAQKANELEKIGEAIRSLHGRR